MTFCCRSPCPPQHLQLRLLLLLMMMMKQVRDQEVLPWQGLEAGHHGDMLQLLMAVLMIIKPVTKVILPMMKKSLLLLLLLLLEVVELKLVLDKEGLHVGLHLHLHELPVNVGARRLLHMLC